MFTIYSSKNCSPNEENTLTPELFVDISKGNKDAFYLLYQKTSSSVYGFLLSILANKEDAEDLLQETYIKIRLHAHNYQHQGKPLAWILTIAKNLAYMKLREKKKASYTDIEDIQLALDFSPIKNIEDRMVLETAFQSLNEDERQIVILHAISGLKHKEISELLQKPIATVLSKYNRSLKKLKKQLRQNEN